ncbi:MAG TPA: RNA-guided endonuclease TnpB family protein [Anaerovoracaceae bacterium]|nr:RNA-guided endonuclease TnpB family protein [Anaerovoracaceae bacterium]
MQQSLRDLDSAYDNFFSGSGFPRFKSKHSSRHSYRTQMVNDNIKVEGNRIQLPKITNRIGVDMGIKSFCYISNEDPVENPKYLKALEKQLARAQRQLASKEKGSGNHQKARLKVARIHERITNQRRDFLHKLSTRLIHENQVVYLEDLRISKMVKDSRLAKSILDCSWSEFFRMMEYKASWYGRDVFHLDAFFPSSQECNVCHFRNPAVKDLKVRTWTCPNCGTVHDRDENASLNILKEGCRLYPAS